MRSVVFPVEANEMHSGTGKLKEATGNNWDMRFKTGEK